MTFSYKELFVATLFHLFSVSASLALVSFLIVCILSFYISIAKLAGTIEHFFCKITLTLGIHCVPKKWHVLSKKIIALHLISTD